MVSQREVVNADTPLTTARILKFYRPLALSWLLMAIESPISLAIISRRPFAEAATAAFLVMMSLALWIESPVIDLLSTSTTLARDRQSFLAIRRFVWILIGGVTLVHFLVVLTPLYGVVCQGLGLPEEVARMARPGLAAMLFWSACIGWRRFLQGVLIRNGETRRVGQGTWVRLITMTTVGLTLHLFSRLDSVLLVGIALMASVAAEALFIEHASRSVVKRVLDSTGSESKLDLRQLVRFHWPLTATTLLVLMGNPVLSFALARAPSPTASMAAWQLAFSLLWLTRTIVFALPEVVISLREGGRYDDLLRRFSLRIGLITSGGLLLLHLTDLDGAFLRRVLQAEPHLVEPARLALMICTLLPLVGAIQSYYRGILTSEHRTRARLSAIVVGSLVLVVSLGVGIGAQWPGVVNAGVSLSASLIAELVVLWIAGRSLAAGSGLEPETS